MWHRLGPAGDADMVTFSGLTSGMDYWFIAVAGRGTGADSEWSAWSGWTADPDPVATALNSANDCPDQPPATDTPPSGPRAVSENNLKGDLSK